MRTFKRELVTTHCVGDEWPEFVGRVELGESFVVETVGCGPNGPIEVAGVKAGDDVAIHIEAIEIEGPFTAASGGPFVVSPVATLAYRDGCFHWPRHFRLPAKPSVGNVAVLPEPTDEILEMSRQVEHEGRTWRNERGWRRVVRDARGKHCHQDCGALRPGAIVHMKAGVDGAGICLDDVHAYIGEGEMAFAGLEVDARVQARVERSTGWLVDWPLIETEDEIMVFSSYSCAYARRPRLTYTDVVCEAYRAMVEVAAARAGVSFEEANTLVATAVDIRNCALYGLEGFLGEGDPPFTTEVAVVAALPKDAFAG
jgi:amidase